MRGRAASRVSPATECVVGPRLRGGLEWGEQGRGVGAPPPGAGDAAFGVWRLRRALGQAAQGGGAAVGALGVRTTGKLVQISKVVRAGRSRRGQIARSVAAGTECKAETRSFGVGGGP